MLPPGRMYQYGRCMYQYGLCNAKERWVGGLSLRPPACGTVFACPFFGSVTTELRPMWALVGVFGRGACDEVAMCWGFSGHYTSAPLLTTSARGKVAWKPQGFRMPGAHAWLCYFVSVGERTA